MFWNRQTLGSGIESGSCFCPSRTSLQLHWMNAVLHSCNWDAGRLQRNIRSWIFLLFSLCGDPFQTPRRAPALKVGFPLGNMGSFEGRVSGGKGKKTKKKRTNKRWPEKSLLCKVLGQVQASSPTQAVPGTTAPGKTATCAHIPCFHLSAVQDCPPQPRFFVAETLMPQAGLKGARDT